MEDLPITPWDAARVTSLEFTNEHLAAVDSIKKVISFLLAIFFL